MDDVFEGEDDAPDSSKLPIYPWMRNHGKELVLGFFISSPVVSNLSKPEKFGF